MCPDERKEKRTDEWMHTEGDNKILQIIFQAKELHILSRAEVELKIISEAGNIKTYNSHPQKYCHVRVKEGLSHIAKKQPTEEANRGASPPPPPAFDTIENLLGKRPSLKVLAFCEYMAYAAHYINEVRKYIWIQINMYI